VLDRLDLDVAPGEIVAVTGPSGCGATTLLRAIAGLEWVDEGTIRLAAPRVEGVFSHTPLPRFGHVHDSVAAIARRTGADDPDDEARRLGALVGLREPDAALHRLARADRRRVVLARALAAQPRLMVLDDPLMGFHTVERALLRDRLAARLRAHGTSAVWVTRETSEAVAVADRVAIMVAGRIVASDRPEGLFAHAADPVVADVLGPVSAVPGIVEGLVVDVWGQEVPLAAAAHDGHCEVVVRPEHVVLVGPDDPGVDAVVQQTTFLGNVRHSVVRAHDGSVVQIEHAVDNRLAPAAHVRIALAPVPVTTRPIG